MRLTTGIDAIDRTLGGGFPPGSLVVLTSPPQAQVDPLLHASLHERPTHYFTTVRDTAAVQGELDRLLDEPEIRSLRAVGVDGGLDTILSDLATIGDGEDVIVSVLDPLEDAVSLPTYVSFLNNLGQRLQESGGVAILHCLDTDDPPYNRNFTLAAADFVWQLRCRRQGRKLAYTLEIPKASGIELDNDERVLALNLGRTVSIDTSRDIA